MSSIIPDLPPDFPRTVVLGATGRLGSMLCRTWGQEAAVWQSRSYGPALYTSAFTASALAPVLAQAQAVVVLAGPAGVGGDVHCDIAQAVLDAAPPRARLLFASSAAVYGRGEGRLSETLPVAPVSPYGRAKVAMEQLCTKQQAQRAPGQLTVLRIGNVAGADAILGGWRAGFSLDQFADGRSPRRSYIGPLGFARVLADLVAYRGPLPPVLNVAAPGAVEMGALLQAADLAYVTRPAPPEAIAEVLLCTDVLARYTDLAAIGHTPHQIVAEWRVLGA